MLGGTADSFAELADMAFMSHPQVEHMAAIVYVPTRAGVKKTSVLDALRRMRLSRTDMDVEGCTLNLGTRTTRVDWVYSEGQLEIPMKARGNGSRGNPLFEVLKKKIANGFAKAKRGTVIIHTKVPTS